MAQLKKHFSRRDMRRTRRYEVRYINQFGTTWANKYRTLFVANIMYYYRVMVGDEVYLNDLKE